MDDRFTARSVGSVEPRPGQGLTRYQSGEIEGEPVWGHNGSDPGVSSFLGLRREQDPGVVVVANTNGADPHSLGIALLRHALGLVILPGT